MARARVRIDLNRDGIRDLARSPGVRTDMARRAFAVRAAAVAAAPMMREGTIEIEATTRTGSDRVRGIVVARHPGVLYAEARHRFLAAAMDAAAG